MLAQAAQLGLEVKQHGRRDPQHHRQLDLVVPHQHAEGVAQHQCRHRRRSGIAVRLLRRTQIGRDHHAADQKQAHRDQPHRTQLGCQVRRQHAEQCGQRKGAQPRLRRRVALALQPHQEADRQRHHVTRQGGQFGGQPGQDLVHRFLFWKRASSTSMPAPDQFAIPTAPARVQPSQCECFGQRKTPTVSGWGLGVGGAGGNRTPVRKPSTGSSTYLVRCFCALSSITPAEQAGSCRVALI